MYPFSHVFLAILILLISLKKSETQCENKFYYVTCESMHNVSDSVIRGVSGMDKAVAMTIRSSPELEIFPNAFHSAVKLLRLLIESNKVLKLHKESFQSPSLSLLSLSYNGIVTIAPGTFSNLPLQTLWLKGNNLEDVPKDLGNLPLESLSFANNKIRSIDNGALANLSSLEHLGLNGNKLQIAVPHLFLTYPQRLRGFYLHNNFLTAVTNYMLQDMGELAILNLGYNSISFVEVNCFENTPKLKTLVLSNNLLKALDRNIFPWSGMQYLRELYLDNNKIMFLSNMFFFPLPHLQEVSLVGNPWLCPCLTVVEKFLVDSNITQTCNIDYTSGRRPICVYDKDSNFECKHVYKDKISEKYVQFHIHFFSKLNNQGDTTDLCSEL